MALFTLARRSTPTGRGRGSAPLGGAYLVLGWASLWVAYLVLLIGAFWAVGAQLPPTHHHNPGAADHDCARKVTP